MISVYDYTDYRLFLKEYYEEQKKLKPAFSYQFMADHCGFASKTFIYKVIKGEKALASSAALKIGAFLKLKKKELDYFETMVKFTNSKTSQEKDFYFQKLQSFSAGSTSALLRQNQYEYLNNWYNPVIRELVTMIDWHEDYSILANATIPPITVWDAKRSVRLLLDLGMIRLDKKGTYYQTEESITTGSDVVSVAIHKFQRDNLKLAADAIDRFKRPQRDISTLTIGISENTAIQITREIEQFRKKIIGMVSKDKNPDRIYQINFQAFPLHLPKKDQK